MTEATVRQSAPRSRALHVTLWIAQLLLFAFFLMAGVNHGLRLIVEAAKGSPWITDLPARFVSFNIVPMLIALFVAWGRSTRARITPRA